jgi:hypothetical protein
MQPNENENQKIEQDSTQNTTPQKEDIQPTNSSVNPIAPDIKPAGPHIPIITGYLPSLAPFLGLGGVYLLVISKNETQLIAAKTFVVLILIICIISALYGGFVKKSLYIATGKFGSYTPTGILAEIIAVISSALEIGLIIIVIKLHFHIK